MLVLICFSYISKEPFGTRLLRQWHHKVIKSSGSSLLYMEIIHALRFDLDIDVKRTDLKIHWYLPECNRKKF